MDLVKKIITYLFKEEEVEKVELGICYERNNTGGLINAVSLTVSRRGDPIQRKMIDKSLENLAKRIGIGVEIVGKEEEKEEK